MNPNPPKFPYGQVVMTIGAAELGQSLSLIPYLIRHTRGDWGDLSDDDKKENDYSVEAGFRILSSYNVDSPLTDKIWIITEADRSATTILLPSEY